MKEPIRTVSFIFQGEFYKSFNSIGRFTINTLTSLGTFDLASKVGMEENETDFGITLAKGGVSSGPYIVLPIIGPSNLRDLSGDVVEYFVDPISNNDLSILYSYLKSVDWFFSEPSNFIS